MRGKPFPILILTAIHEMFASGFSATDGFDNERQFMTALQGLSNSSVFEIRSTFGCSISAKNISHEWKEVSIWTLGQSLIHNGDVAKLFEFSMTPLCSVNLCSRNPDAEDVDASVCNLEWSVIVCDCFVQKVGILISVFYIVQVFDEMGDCRATLSKSYPEQDIADTERVCNAVSQITPSRDSKRDLFIHNGCLSDHATPEELSWEMLNTRSEKWYLAPYRWHDWLVPLYGEAVRFLSRLNEANNTIRIDHQPGVVRQFRFPVVVVNLAKRSDKKIHMADLLQQLGFADVSFPNVTASTDIHVPTLLENGLATVSAVEFLEENEYIGKKASLSYLANAVDQIKLISEAALQGYPFFAVFEDDIIPAAELSVTRSRIRDALEALPATADMLYLEACFEECDNISYTEILTSVVRASSPACSAAIIYTAKGAAKVSELCMPIFGGIDTMYPQLIKEGKLEAYIANPIAFFQDAIWGSDVERDQAYRAEDLARSKGQKHAILSPLCWEAEDMVDKMILESGLVLGPNMWPLLREDSWKRYFRWNDDADITFSDDWMRISPYNGSSLIRASDGAIYVFFRQWIGEWARQTAWNMEKDGKYIGFYTEDVDAPGVFKVEIAIWSNFSRNPAFILPTSSLCWGLAHFAVVAPPCPIEILLVSEDGSELDSVKKYLYFAEFSADTS